MLEAPLARAAPQELAPAFGAAIASVAAATPAKVVSNARIAERLGVDERWIESRTGIRERHVVRTGERMLDLAVRAGADALEAGGARAADLDMVLVATVSHDELTPSAAPQVAAALGATNAGALDLGAACTGFVAALDMATAQVEARRAERVLVIGADVLSRHVDPFDRSTAALFGDGAGAALIVPSAPGRIGPAVLAADGTGADLIRARHPRAVIAMRGPDTFSQAVDRLSEVTLQAAARSGIELGDVDLFVYHQANARILRAVGQRLGLPAERVPDYISRYGNTSAASIPIALAECEREGRLVPGMRVLIAAFGAGLTWGGAVLEWGCGDRA
ncbi:MAG: beta-ketoacyl-ACP synthase 3 [Thermoleophilaceae bacterium]